jgi:hypothetical protein
MEPQSISMHYAINAPALYLVPGKQLPAAAVEQKSGPIAFKGRSVEQ